ncbi:MAG: aminoacyl-tRNA hydrolase [Candidatus Melainabacteria bacterium]|nr:aminoacyl-tRNA hydrolase [Candidatus Melainabacteria bacterium]
MNELKPQKYKLIVGLGNPDKEHMETRHNVGFDAVDAFGKKYQIELKHDKKLSSWCGKRELAVNGEVYQVILAKPDTYMNHSGIAVNKLLNWYKVNVSSLLIIHDEVALDLGKIRISHGRGPGGHHGVESIIESIGGKQEFTRLRIGVGPDPGGDIRKDYVLGKFTNKEKEILSKVINLTIEAIETLLEQNVEFTMNKYNGVELGA